MFYKNSNVNCCEEADFFPALENELLKLPPLPIVTVKELLLSHQVPILLFPPATKRWRKDVQFTAPLIPICLFQFVSLMHAH